MKHREFLDVTSKMYPAGVSHVFYMGRTMLWVWILFIGVMLFTTSMTYLNILAFSVISAALGIGALRLGFMTTSRHGKTLRTFHTRCTLQLAACRDDDARDALVPELITMLQELIETQEIAVEFMKPLFPRDQ